MFASLSAAVSHRRGFLVTALLIVLGSLLWDRFAWPTFDLYLSAFDYAATPFRDFEQVYYPTAQNFFTTHEPSALYIYPPVFALMLSPLGAMPYKAALAIWIGVQAVALGVLIAVPTRLFLKRSALAALAYVALVCFSQPVLHNFRWGQVSTIVTAALFVSGALYQRDARFRSAVALALPIAVKLYPAVIGFYYLLRRDVRYVLTVAALVIGVSALPVLVLGPAGLMRYISLTGDQMAFLIPRMRNNINSENLANVLMRIVFWEKPDESWRFVFKSLAILLLGAALWRLNRSRQAESKEWAKPLAFLLLVLPLVVETCWPHYLVFLPFCQILVWLGATGTLGALITQRGLAVLSMLLSTTPLFRLIDNHVEYTGFGLLTFADLFLLAPLAWQLGAEPRTTE